MTFDAPDNGHEISAGESFDRVPDVRMDFEKALLDGLPDAPPLSSQDPDPAGPPDAPPPADGIDAEFESLLLAGLGDTSSEDRSAPDPPDAAANEQAAHGPESQEPEPEAPLDPEFESALLDGLSDEPAVARPARDDPLPPEEPAAPQPASDADPAPGESAPEPVFDFEIALMEGLPDGSSVLSDDSRAPAPPNSAPPTAEPNVPADPTEGAFDASAGNLADALLETLSEGQPASSGDLDPTELPTVPEPDTLPPETEPGPDSPDPGEGLAAAIDARAEDPPGQGLTDGPVAALAFAADPETENALREGLLQLEGPTPDHEDPQVWPGGLRAAVAALAQAHSTPLVIVDIDGIDYPAGALHDLAEVCEMGTVVIAMGSEDSARLNRELLLAGVSDYLVKPVAPAAVRHAAMLATASPRTSPISGHIAGFVGTGGSGATTVAAAVALHAAGQGRYVSILDLNRTVPALALLLDVEPSAGLDQLLDVAGRIAPDPQMLDGVRSQRLDRISLYAYRLADSPPPVPPLPVLDWLLQQLKQRSQLVLVDGLDRHDLHFPPLAEIDTPVLVAEPTVAGAVRAARILDLLAGGAPPLLVQNHTRRFTPDAGASLLLGAGIERPPDAVIPFEAALSEIADRGWPGGRLPRRMRKPVAALADRIVAQAIAGRAGLAEPSREA